MYKFEKYKLEVPSLEEVAEVLREQLKKTFSIVEVDVVCCPDLTKKPFMLSSAGICGSTSLTDVGGKEYLMPQVTEGKNYNVRDIVRKIGLKHAFVLGAGGGCRSHIGSNGEMTADLTLGENEVINMHISKVEENGGFQVRTLKDCTDFTLSGNLFTSEGKPGKVIKVLAKQRIGSDSFPSAIRAALNCHFKNQTVGVGGVFLINKGNVQVHIMPEYSETPLKTHKDLFNWMKFFEISAPLVCMTMIQSYDPGLILREHHTHCFSDHGVGGHYHWDVTPDEIEYEGYFNLAETLYRADQPPEEFHIGKD